MGSALLFTSIEILREPAPPVCAIVADTRLKEAQQDTLVDRFTLVNLDCPRCPVLLALVYQALRIRRNEIVDEHGEMIPRFQQRADVAMHGAIRLPGARDGLTDLRVDSMNENLAPGDRSPAARKGASAWSHRCEGRSVVYSSPDDATILGVLLSGCQCKRDQEQSALRTYSSKQDMTEIVTLGTSAASASTAFLFRSSSSIKRSVSYCWTH